jgi:flagellar hook-length control protein FliK
MQIDIAGAPSNSASAIEPTGAPSETGKTSKSFADLLHGVAEDQDESTPVDEVDEEEPAGDEWVTMPVVVPFVPVITQDIVETENDGNATSVEAISEDIATDAVDAPLPAVAASRDVESFVDREAPKPQATTQPPESATTESSAPAESSARIVPIAEEAVIEVATDVPTATATTDTPAETALPIDAKPSASSEPPPKAGKATKAATKAPDVHEVTRPVVTEEAASSTLPGAVGDVTAQTASQPDNAQKEPVSNKGVAARFARAIERAIEHAVAPARAAGENGQSANQNGDGQPSFGEWLREQLPQLAAAGARNGAAPVFALAAPAQNDARVSGLLAASGVNLPASTSALPNERDVTVQIVQSMRMQFRDGIGEAVLRLKPEHLGAVSISLRVENGGLKANVQADMPAVRQWLESQQDTLRSALAEHGLRLDRFDVEPDAQRQQADDEGRREQSRKRQLQKREAEQPVFEVVV